MANRFQNDPERIWSELQPDESASREDLTREQRDALSAEFATIAQHDQGLAQILVEYVEGTHTQREILEVLSRFPQADELIAVHSATLTWPWQTLFPLAERRRALLMSAQRLPTDVLRRLGEVYAAATSIDETRPVRGLFPSWCLALLAECAVVHGVAQLSEQRLYPLPVSEFVQASDGDVAFVEVLLKAGLGIGRGAVVQSPRGFLFDWTELVGEWGQVVTQFPDALDTILAASRAAERNQAWSTLAGWEFDVAPLNDTLMTHAIAAPAASRLHVVRVLQRDLETSATALRQVAGSGSARERGRAIELLAELQGVEAIDFLQQQLTIEKAKSVRSKIETALIELGASPAALEIGTDADAHWSPDRQLEAATKRLARKRPAGMEWIMLDGAPPVHWSDSGVYVDPTVLEWWVVEAVAHRSPQPWQELEAWLAECRRDDLKEFAADLLRMWIAYDTAPPPAVELDRQAEAEAERAWPSVAHQYSSRDQLVAEIRRRKAQQRPQSAIRQKGLLALVAVAGGRECVAQVNAYLKAWYGKRTAQCKALIEMLAGMRDPAATQLLVSLATSFRTRSLQRHAEQLVDALAERNGWTREELADRAVPDGGLSRSDAESATTPPSLTLDYGGRLFRAVLDEQCRLMILREDGQRVKNLPKGAKADDPGMVERAREQFRDLKQTVKDVVKQQTARLRDAMCTQRQWSWQEWRQFITGHPIVGRLTPRLIWVAWERADDAAPYSGTWFRPLEDGTLTTVDDEEYDVPALAHISLAHPALAEGDELSAWRAHLIDYDVDPLFDQLNRPVYNFDGALGGGAIGIDEISGLEVGAMRLHSQATRLGWTRGPVDDFSWYRTYEKSVAACECRAVLRLSGCSVLDRFAEVTFERVEFWKDNNHPAEGSEEERMPITDVPLVLLSECYADVLEMADRS